MKFLIRPVSLGVVLVVLLSGCGGGTSNSPFVASTPVANPPAGQATGSISVSITDDPWEDAQALVLHITAMEMGHSNGDIISLDLPGGPMSIDMMGLQNGLAQELISRMVIPAGQYDWMRLNVDLSQSYLDLAGTGGRHNMQMGSDSPDGLEVREPFQILASGHDAFMLDFNLRSGMQHHNMGMMGDQFELHSAMRLINMEDSGGVNGLIDPAMIDVNHPDCDDAMGGNWAYLFPGNTTEPDDIAELDSDSRPGPMATDRVEMNVGTGEHFYHFGYLPAGSYRIAFTCSGEWDEDGDDDYPSDPDGHFDFQMFSNPFDVVAGEMHRFDMMSP